MKHTESDQQNQINIDLMPMMDNFIETPELSQIQPFQVAEQFK